MDTPPEYTCLGISPAFPRVGGKPDHVSSQGKEAIFVTHDIYIVPRAIKHNPGVSLPLIISGHGFCGYPWLSRSEGGPFSLAVREELTLVLGFWELYILYLSQ